MPKGNEIVVTSNPKGMFLEGTIQDTSLPGTIMQIKAATKFVSGRPSWISANVGTNGKQALHAVLLPDNLQGKTTSDAYVSGTRCFLYVPISGEELNVLCGISGSVTFAIGDRLMLYSGSGILTADSGSPQQTSWVAMEAITVSSAPGLVYCMRL